MSDEMPVQEETEMDNEGTICAEMAIGIDTAAGTDRAARGEAGGMDSSAEVAQNGAILRTEPGLLGISPVYSRSRAVLLNADTLEENRLIACSGDAAEVEQFRLIRTQILQRAAGKGGVTVMVTSALPREGKTLIAINLALTFAKEYNQTALLVDCDLRQQAIHAALGFPSDLGLVDYLVHDCPIPDLMVWPGVEKLTVISGGRTLTGSTELLGSPRMRDLVADLKRRYPERYVIFDVPSLLTSADPLAFAPLVDYIVVVVQAGKTALPDINKALKMLPREKVVGLVLNRQDGR